MKRIADIRFFKSMTENVDGNPHPSAFMAEGVAPVMHRIVMKLREQGFSLGEFDHLYLNFTTCLQRGESRCAKRSVDRCHPWYRYYDVGVDGTEYDSLGEAGSVDTILAYVRQTLLRHFAGDDGRNMICESIAAALREGEEMKALYKEKKSAGLSAELWLRYMDSGIYRPLLCVYGPAGEALLRQELPEMADLFSLGEIRLSRKTVRILPRKTVFAAGREPLVYGLSMVAAPESREKEM